MKFLEFIRASVFQIISLIFVLCFILGVLNVYFSDNNNYCVMTYMYEYPQFVRLSLPENKEYPQYGLYAYSEGRLTEKARKMWFDGVPVLFLPGNAGSHMQARSIASVALRKALSSGVPYHFDFFTISYNEELSGLYGGVLESQTKFAASCISKILSLYKNKKYSKTIPTTVILIGHSMGGLIAKRLLAYPDTINSTSIAIALAAPIDAAVINVDAAMDEYYMRMNFEWETNIKNNIDGIREKKLLLGFGNGPRDVLVPSCLTSSNDSYISALTTAVPGVWVSPDHVSILWCKQLVLAINRFLFSIVDYQTEQIVEDSQKIMARARQYFQANRSMNFNPETVRSDSNMVADAFWYEDNRRSYQVSRPHIDKTTYLMIRLVRFPQNRFVAIEAVNVDDKDWIFGCNAKFTYSTYRYCKTATSLSELSRWTGAANDFGKRKLATIHLHNIKEMYPDWTHVIVKVSPTGRPIVLNVDINDHASREIFIDMPSDFSFGKTIIKSQTEPDSLYYELILKGFNVVHQAYLLYIEPISCKSAQYHVTAEMHVPWAANNENYHYFTQLKRSPMKLRLFKSNPNITYGVDATEHVKVTLLLDPQCTYTISISPSWYYRLAQLVRNYTPVIVPYVAAIVLLAARSNLMHLRDKGSCVSIHRALASEGVKPYYALVFARLAATVLASVPILSFLLENASSNNLELHYFIKSLLVLPVYMTALGIVNVAMAAVLAVMVFSSQIAHRLFFRIMWRGSSSLAEKMASGLQKVPMLVTGSLLFGAPLSCGAAALVAGAAFYAFMLSKMYEEYLEDYVYKLMAKIASRVCRMFKNKKSTKEDETNLVKADLTAELSSQNNEQIINKNDKENIIDDTKQLVAVDKSNDNSDKIVALNSKNVSKSKDVTSQKECETKNKLNSYRSDLDEDLNNLNFHMMMFSMWSVVTLVNVPALLTWARNFSYSMVLKPDTSYHTGLVMSACSAYIWQLDGPRKNLKHYDAISALLFTMAVFIFVLGPLSLTIVNYGVTFMFTIITIQQMWDFEEISEDALNETQENTSDPDPKSKENDEHSETSNPSTSNDNCNVCNENRIFNIFSKLKEKFDFTENL